MDQQRPTRRMTDMGPARRMDGFGRTGARPVAAPGSQPVQQASPMQPAGAGRMRSAGRVAAGPAPQQRPVGTAPQGRMAQPQRPAAAGAMPQQRVAPAGAQPRAAAQRPMQRTAQAQPMPSQQAAQMLNGSQPAATPRQASSGGGWRVVVQFVVGLLVIIGVAAAIVALYVRYYQ